MAEDRAAAAAAILHELPLTKLLPSMSRTAAILLAAGSGRRMQGAVEDKVLAPLAGRPVFCLFRSRFFGDGVADLYVVVYRESSADARAFGGGPDTPRRSSGRAGEAGLGHAMPWRRCQMTSPMYSSNDCARAFRPAGPAHRAS